MAWHVQQADSAFAERPGQIKPPVPQVTSRKRAYKLNSTDLLHAYLLRLAADMHQTADVPSAAPVEGHRDAGLSLWKCLLAAAAVAVAHRVRKQLTATFKVASASAAWQSMHVIRGIPGLAHFAAQHPAVKSCLDNDLPCMLAKSYLVSILQPFIGCHPAIASVYMVIKARLYSHISCSFVCLLPHGLQAVEHGDKQVGTASRPAARASGGAKGSKPVSDMSRACQLLGTTHTPPTVCKLLHMLMATLLWTKLFGQGCDQEHAKAALV